MATPSMCSKISPLSFLHMRSTPVLSHAASAPADLDWTPKLCGPPPSEAHTRTEERELSHRYERASTPPLLQADLSTSPPPSLLPCVEEHAVISL